MNSELNKQVTKLKTQAKFAKIKLKLEMSDEMVMIYPKHRSDIVASLGYLLLNNNVDIIAYIIDMKRLEWARMEGFSEKQLRDENESLKIFKEIRPDSIVSHLV